MKLSVNYIKWLLSADRTIKPMHFTDAAGEYDPSVLSAHQLALIEAYPAIEQFSTLIADAHVIAASMHDDYYPNDAELQSHRVRNLLAGLADHSHVTWNPFSFLNYLSALFYFSWGKEAINGNRAASFTLLLPWILLRAAGIVQIAAILVFGPIQFILNFLSHAAPPIFIGPVRYLRTFYHFCRERVQRVFTCHNTRDNKTTTATIPENWKKYWENDEEAHTDSTKDSTTLAAAFSKAIHTFSTKASTTVAPAFSEAIHTFAPIWEILEPLYQHSLTNKRWQWALGGAVVLMLGAAVFLDYVLYQVLTELYSRGNLRAGFMDQFGGHYAEVAWHHIADAAVVSWEHMQIGMEFFVYALVNKAVLPFFGWMDISIAHTSHTTSAQVGTVLLEVLLPLTLVALYTYRMLRKCDNIKVARKEAQEAEKIIPDKERDEFFQNPDSRAISGLTRPSPSIKAKPCNSTPVLLSQGPSASRQNGCGLIQYVRSMFF